MSVVPFFVESCYLYLSRLSGKQSSTNDTIGIIVSIIIGYIPLFRVRMGLLVRISVSAVYITGLVLLLTLFSFVFVCVIFRDCL